MPAVDQESSRFRDRSSALLVHLGKVALIIDDEENGKPPTFNRGRDWKSFFPSRDTWRSRRPGAVSRIKLGVEGESRQGTTGVRRGEVCRRVVEDAEL